MGGSALYKQFIASRFSLFLSLLSFEYRIHTVIYLGHATNKQSQLSKTNLNKLN